MRFERLYIIDQSTDCWLWQGTIRSGHGQFKAEGRTVQAARWSWERAHGPLPRGVWLAHDCDSTSCVNPAHLRPVDPGAIAGAHERAKTHCPAGHPYDDANTYVTPTGKRMCRACRRAS